MGGAAAIPIGLQIAGTALQARSAYVEGAAQQNYYRYLAQNKRNQAALETKSGEQEAGLAIEAGQSRDRLLTSKVADLEGTQRAAAGENVGGGSGSTADIASDTFNKAHLDKMAIAHNADIAAWRARNNAALKSWGLNQEAQDDELAGEEAKRAGKIKVATSILSGASQVSSSFLKSRPTSSS